MVYVRRWLVGAAVGWVVALGLVACSDSSERAEPGAAGAGTGGTAGAGTGGAAGASTPTGGGAGSSAETREVRSEATYDTSPDVGALDYQAFISSTNDFGLDVFAQLGTDDLNVVFSPVSVAVALGMTYAGARSNTAAQMAAVLHNGLSDDAFHAANNQLAIDLASRNIAPHETEAGEKSVRLSLVNATWAQDGYEILAPFLDILASNYDAGLKLVDFISDPEACRLVINQWVADQTEDKIPDLIGPDALTRDTRLVLTNALYFYGTWSDPFLVESTSDGTFYTLSGGEVTVPMMHQSSSLSYAEGDGYQMVDLPYDGRELAMTVVLPEAGRFHEIRELVSSDWLEQARASIAAAQVELTLPKFSFTWGTESLKPTLIGLGMTDAFQPGVADLTGIVPTPELYVSDVLHQAFIGVDESGTEAAAATAVIIDRYTSVPDSGIPFTVDRPFLFFIRDTTGLLLFTGQVTLPDA
jgi:serpin B